MIYWCRNAFVNIISDLSVINFHHKYIKQLEFRRPIEKICNSYYIKKIGVSNDLLVYKGRRIRILKGVEQVTCSWTSDINNYTFFDWKTSKHPLPKLPEKLSLNDKKKRIPLRKRGSINQHGWLAFAQSMPWWNETVRALTTVTYN